MDIKKNNLALFNTINIDRHLINIFPGGEWLYYNIYINQNSTDALIIELAKKLKNINGFDYSEHFFFVRYYEEEKQDHLRIRIKIAPEAIGGAITDLHVFFRSNISVRNISLETYQREITRYGWPSILNVEELFCIDTQLTCQFLVDDLHIQDLDKMQFCITNINHYLDSFGYTEENKLRFVENAKSNFFVEFNVDGISKKSINKAYSQHIKNVFSLENISDKSSDNSLHLKRNSLCKSIIEQQSEDHKDDLVWSIIHMFVNKIFSKKNRLYELMAYDFLYKILQTQYHKGQQNIK